jgi:hypothetical protein
MLAADQIEGRTMAYSATLISRTEFAAGAVFATLGAILLSIVGLQRDLGLAAGFGLATIGFGATLFCFGLNATLRPKAVSRKLPKSTDLILVPVLTTILLLTLAEISLEQQNADWDASADAGAVCFLAAMTAAVVHVLLSKFVHRNKGAQS